MRTCLFHAVIDVDCPESVPCCVKIYALIEFLIAIQEEQFIKRRSLQPLLPSPNKNSGVHAQKNAHRCERLHVLDREKLFELSRNRQGAFPYSKYSCAHPIRSSLHHEHMKYTYSVYLFHARKENKLRNYFICNTRKMTRCALVLRFGTCCDPQPAIFGNDWAHDLHHFGSYARR